MVGVPPNPGGVPGPGAWHCAKVAYQLTTAAGAATILDPTNFTTVISQGAMLTGAAMTGANNNALQTCFYLAVPDGLGGSGGTLFQFGNKAQSFGGSGVMTVTPLPFTNFPPGSGAFIDVYDVNNPLTNGGVGAAEHDCPQATAGFFNGNVVNLRLVDEGHQPNMDRMDRRLFLTP